MQTVQLWTLAKYWGMHKLLDIMLEVWGTCKMAFTEHLFDLCVKDALQTTFLYCLDIVTCKKIPICAKWMLYAMKLNSQAKRTSETRWILSVNSAWTSLKIHLSWCLAWMPWTLCRGILMDVSWNSVIFHFPNIHFVYWFCTQGNGWIWKD